MLACEDDNSTFDVAVVFIFTLAKKNENLAQGQFYFYSTFTIKNLNIQHSHFFCRIDVPQK